MNGFRSAATLVAILFAALSLMSCSDPKSDAERALWDGAKLAKVCVDGTHIYHLTNGEYRTGGFVGNLVDDPQTVCASYK